MKLSKKTQGYLYLILAALVLLIPIGLLVGIVPVLFLIGAIFF